MRHTAMLAYSLGTKAFKTQAPSTQPRTLLLTCVLNDTVKCESRQFKTAQWRLLPGVEMQLVVLEARIYFSRLLFIRKFALNHFISIVYSTSIYQHNEMSECELRW